MSFSAKVYKVFIASPSDVAEERKLIPEVLHEWNTNNSEHYGIVFLPIKWETHVMPTWGNRSQALINEQVVEKSDILVGVFGTKLGSPTGVAQSGTVEEIEQFQQSGKTVMLYFSSKDIPRHVDRKDLAKLEAYQKVYQQRGIYGTYDSNEKLKTELMNHLTIFANDYYNTRPLEAVLTTDNQLSVQFYKEDTEEKTDVIENIKYIFPRVDIVNDTKKSLIDLIKEIDSIEAYERINKKNEGESNLFIEYKVDFWVNVSTEEKAELTSKTKKLLDVDLIDSFFNFGDLTETRLNTFIEQSPVLNGTPEEIEKYKLYKDYRYKLYELEALENYLNYLSQFSVIPLTLSNMGQKYNQAINVKLTFPKHIDILRAETIESPNYYIYQAINDSLFEFIFKTKESSEIEAYQSEGQNSYTGGPVKIPLVRPKTYHEKLEDLNEEFDGLAENILYFKHHSNKNNQTLKFEFDELNPATDMWFPCYLFVKAAETFDIEYEITSKNLSQKITGTLTYTI